MKIYPLGHEKHEMTEAEVAQLRHLGLGLSMKDDGLMWRIISTPPTTDKGDD